MIEVKDTTIQIKELSLADRARYALDSHKRLYETLLSYYFNSETDNEFIYLHFIGVLGNNLQMGEIYINWLDGNENTDPLEWRNCLQFMKYVIEHLETVVVKLPN